MIVDKGVLAPHSQARKTSITSIALAIKDAVTFQAHTYRGAIKAYLAY